MLRAAATPSYQAIEANSREYHIGRAGRLQTRMQHWRGARKTREWKTRHEMTWKCGRLMRQLNFREYVDGRSFMYTLNRQGDKTEPWGRPFLWSLQELHLSAMCTRKRLSVRNRATVSTISRGRVLESFCSRPRRQTAS